MKVLSSGGDTESSADGQRGDKEQAGGKTKPLTRHQRKKLAKIREKYGDQDEEERLIRMKLMGSKEVKVVEEQQQQQQRQDEEEDDDVVVGDILDCPMHVVEFRKRLRVKT